VLRIPSSYFFDPADTRLKPDGRTMLKTIAEAATGTTGRFDLRVETFTDSGGETPALPAPAPGAPKPEPAQPVDAWTLTAGRAAALAHELRDSGAMPFQNVVAVGRADFAPLDSNAKQGHSRNRRVEITIAPVPTPFRAPEPSKTAHAKAGPPPAVPATTTSASTGLP
jgi:outer membrane protein OmpA-like peptidoglycan-associated protein